MKDIRNTEESVDKDSDILFRKTEDIKGGKSGTKQWQKWQRILFGIIIICCVIILGGIIVFSFLKVRGENSLRTQGKHILYNGEEYRYREEVVNILCLGIDKDIPLAYVEEGRGNIGMTDATLVASLNMKKHSVKILAIPRDTIAYVQTTNDGSFASIEQLQICYQYAYGTTMQQGCDLTKTAVSRLLYDIPIQRCCAINSRAIPVLNDAIGGVDVEVQEKDLEKLYPEFKYGKTVHLKGESAERYVTVRNKYNVDGSFLRTQRQKQYAYAFIETAKNAVVKDPSIPVTAFQELQKDGNMYTDITLEDISYLMSGVWRMSFSDDMIEVIPGESMIGEDGYVEYHKDTDELKKIIVDIFYEKL